jgi:WD40 repeat protein
LAGDTTFTTEDPTILLQGPDGTKFASASADELLCLWKLSSSKKVFDDDDGVLSLKRLQIR